MDDERAVKLATAAGLGRALEQCREDVIAAALEAESLRRALDATFSPSDEPWPPMVVKTQWPPHTG